MKVVTENFLNMGESTSVLKCRIGIVNRAGTDDNQ